MVGEEKVEIWLRGNCVAQHVRSFEPYAWVRDPRHFEGLFRREAESQAPTRSEVISNPVSRPLSIYSEVVEGGCS